MGEEPALAYLKALHRNVNQYTRSGPAPARNTARGETAVGVMFLHDGAMDQKHALTGGGFDAARVFRRLEELDI